MGILNFSFFSSVLEFGIGSVFSIMKREEEKEKCSFLNLPFLV
jgi:hypothetical protein